MCWNACDASKCTHPFTFQMKHDSKRWHWWILMVFNSYETSAKATQNSMPNSSVQKLVAFHWYFDKAASDTTNCLLATDATDIKPAHKLTMIEKSIFRPCLCENKSHKEMSTNFGLVNLKFKSSITWHFACVAHYLNSIRSFWWRIATLGPRLNIQSRLVYRKLNLPKNRAHLSC